MLYCSLQHQLLLSPPDTSTAEHPFCLGPASSFLLELLLCSCPVACWTPSNLRGSPWGVISFCLFPLHMEFSRQEYCSGLSFPPPVDCALSELFTTTSVSWVVLHSMAHSFIELHKLLCHGKDVITTGNIYIYKHIYK